jgi:hypothetical protein
MASVEMIDSVPFGGDRVKCTPFGKSDIVLLILSYMLCGVC